MLIRKIARFALTAAAALLLAPLGHSDDAERPRLSPPCDDALVRP